jgi:hypothetical protein
MERQKCLLSPSSPIHFAGSEIVEFSPTDALGETIGVVLENLRAASVEA